MKQAEKISNDFSDAYLLALVEGTDAEKVLDRYAKEFPELASQFSANAVSLDLMHGDLRNAKPSEEEIAAAYKTISERIDPAPAVHHTTSSPRKNIFAELRKFFSGSPTRSGASLGIAAAVILALLWQPWNIKHSEHESAHNTEAPANHEEHSTAPEIASADQHHEDIVNDPNKIPEVQYRGGKKDNQTAAQKRTQDSIDAARLKALATPKPLIAPAELRLESPAPGQIMIRWKSVEGALSYIVEMKGANDARFEPVTQISQTGTRVTSLESGHTYFVRVIAANGERKGPASDVKSIVVP